MGGQKRSSWIADFETTTDPEDCRVWAWGIAHIETAETTRDVEIGADVESFMMRAREGNNIIYFHNLAFDGAFMLDWLFHAGYEYTADRPRRGQFSTLISNMGKFFSISVSWDNGKRTEFRDSLKKLPMSVEKVAKAFKLEIAKGEIDYHAKRPVGHRITEDERIYIALDVLIISKALRVQLAEGMTKLTVGADSLAEFKRLTNPKIFNKYFPVLPPTMDAEIRKSYRGGFAYADPRYKGQVLGGGKVYDVNSLYPAVMYDRLLPYGEPVFFVGKPKPDENRPLYITSITFTAKLKPDHVPCIQVKNSGMFLATEYQTEIKEPTTIMVTGVDLALWQDHYDMDILSYNGGWAFYGSTGFFTDYIDKWAEIKATATGGRREIAKLHLNSLYGKFATNPDVSGKYPVMEDGIVKLKAGPEESRDPVYTAMGSFITAYARDVTIRAAQDNYEHFAYADTDSLHLLTSETPKGMEIHPTDLGAWKFEGAFTQAIFMRAKQYAEKMDDGTYSTHIAGLDRKIAEQLTIADITAGNEFKGKLTPQRVPGGIVLTETTFTIKA